jgi:hypothetical protein
MSLTYIFNLWKCSLNQKSLYFKEYFPEKTFPCGSFPGQNKKKKKLGQFSAQRALGSCHNLNVPDQTKKKKNWDNFLGANLQVCYPKGPFFKEARGRPWTRFF